MPFWLRSVICSGVFWAGGSFRERNERDMNRRDMLLSVAVSLIGGARIKDTEVGWVFERRNGNKRYFDNSKKVYLSSKLYAHSAQFKPEMTAREAAEFYVSFDRENGQSEWTIIKAYPVERGEA